MRDCFDRLYGSDLVRALKSGPAYYARVFADSGIDPADALVVDDKPAMLAWAAGFGALTAVVGVAKGDYELDLRAGSRAELPEAIREHGRAQRPAPTRPTGQGCGILVAVEADMN